MKETYNTNKSHANFIGSKHLYVHYFSDLNEVHSRSLCSDWKTLTFQLSVNAVSNVYSWIQQNVWNSLHMV